MMRRFIFGIAALILSIAAFAQEGSDCTNPTTIANLPYNVEGVSTFGTCPYTFPNYTMRSGNYVFKFVPTEDQTINITISGISRSYEPTATPYLTYPNVGVFLYQGCPDDENAQLIGSPFVSSSGTATSGSISGANITASTEYYIVVAADSLIYNYFITSAASYTTATFNLTVEKVVENDVAIRTVTAANSGCEATTTVSYTIANNGTLEAAENAVSVVCKVNGVDVATDNLPAMASGATLTRTFDNVALAEGSNTIQIVATLVGDENPENNTGNATANRNTLITSFPYIENFELEPYKWTPSQTGAWVAVTGDEGIYYMTDTTVSKNSYIVTPCLSFAGMEMPELHFDVLTDYPVSSGGMGDIFGGESGPKGHVLASTNGSTWDTVAPIEATNVWVRKNISLSRYAGESVVLIRISYNAGWNIGSIFGGTTTGGAGISVDNIDIRDAAMNDLGVTAITGPASGCGLSGNSHVSVTIKNYGRAAQSNYVVEYSVDGGANWTIETVNAEIAAGATAQYTFNNALNLTNYGTYNIIARTALAGDEDASNDEAEGTVVSQGLYNSSNAVAIFYDTEFINDWYAVGTYSSWIYGKTAIGPNDSIWTWATNPNGPVNPGEVSYLYSPCYNLTGMTNPIIKISMWYNLSAMDIGDDTGEMPFDPSSMFGVFGGALSLQYSINGGSAWINVVANDGDLSEGWYTSNMMTEGMSDPGWSGNTNGFVAAKTVIRFPTNADLSNIKFRFAFKTTNMNMGDDSGMGGFFQDIFGSMTGSNSIGGAAISSFVIYDCSPLPTAEFSYSQELCTGTQIQFTNNSQNADSYAWNFGDGQGLDLSELTSDSGFDLGAFFGDGSTTSTEENPTMTYNSEGNYVVTLTATNECGTSIQQETLNILSCTSIDEVETETSIYPNPASQNITITNVENADIEIVNALGQVVYANKNASGNISIDVRNFTNGTYFVKVNGSVSKINVVK